MTDRVTEIEATRRLEEGDKISNEKRIFYTELYRQMKEKNIPLPPNVQPPRDIDREPET